MKRESIVSELKKASAEEHGQALPFIALLMTAILGLAALSVDLGHLYFCHRQLQTACDAAALAGAYGLPDVTAGSTATSYSAVGSGSNAYPQLVNVTMSTGFPKLLCLSTLTSSGVPCVAPANANAIQVKQQAIVPTYFARIFGIQTVTMTATATASMRGASPTPYNVAVIIDSTASMKDLDTDSNCSATRISCALSGMRVLLNSLSPCASSQSSCGSATNGKVSNAVDNVSLFTFPNVSSAAQAQNDYNCSLTPPTSSPYSFPTAGASTYSPTSTTYRIVDYSSDYKTSSTSTTLATSSNLVAAAGGKSLCNGLQAIGGQGTYYAGVIYAAQASLVAAAAANPGTQNVMIILGDGDSNASGTAMTGSSKTSGVYPSTQKQCQQAITAAGAATAAGTRVYSVAYGATASGCSTDVGLSPCQTMQRMASASQYFYSDYTAKGGSSSCISASQPTTNLNQIFTAIAGDLTVARLIPDNTP